MRKVGLSVAVTIIAFMGFVMCCYVLLTAPQLLSFMQRGVFLYGLDTGELWLRENYRLIGFFVTWMALAFLFITGLNVRFLMLNMRLSVNFGESGDEKAKRVRLAEMDAEEDIADLRELVKQSRR